jgi:hypothetical protein
MKLMQLQKEKETAEQVLHILWTVTRESKLTLGFTGRAADAEQAASNPTQRDPSTRCSIISERGKKMNRNASKEGSIAAGGNWFFHSYLAPKRLWERDIETDMWR